jgi:hypothetical protein
MYCSATHSPLFANMPHEFFNIATFSFDPNLTEIKITFPMFIFGYLTLLKD